MIPVNKISLENEILKKIGRVADDHSIEAYVVGGYVRDLLLGREVKDIDVVVLGEGVAFAKLVSEELGKKNLVTFEKFGTAALHIDDTKIEFVGARKESYSKDSRKPFVEGGTLEDDLSRRDFTINALAASLNKESWGTVVDVFNGREDLEKKLLRTPLDPKVTFDDDPLRIMRAMRFSAQLQFEVDGTVLEAARDMRKRLSIVSQERISDEFLKLMKSEKPSVGLMLMHKTGVMEVVFPEIAEMEGVDQRQDHHHKDVLLHTMMVVDNVSRLSNDLWLRIAALLHDVAKPKTKAFSPGIGWTFHGHDEIGSRMVKPIFRRMKFPLDHVNSVEKLVRLHLRPMALVDEQVTDSAVRRLMFDAGEEIDALMILCSADITSKNPKLVAYVKKNYERVLEKMKEVEEKDKIRNWQPPLRGNEIMEVCRLEPGPLVGRLKQAITEAILDGIIANDHDQALDYLLKIRQSVFDGGKKKLS